MASESITRRQLTASGFTRMPDVWLYCPRRRRHEYFERWYHADWNVAFMPGYASSDQFSITLEELSLLLQARRKSRDLLRDPNAFTWCE